MSGYAPYDRSREYEVPFSRLFILNGTQNVSQEDVKEAFKQYGNVRNVKKILDKQTKTDRKGWCNVQFSKASEAFLARENLNGVTLPGAPRPLKVVIAHDKNDEYEFDNEEPINRILVKIPKDWGPDKVREAFEEFGSIQNVHVLRNKQTDEPKGLAFVRFERPYCAALALEECDSSFRPVFATDKPPASRMGARNQPPLPHDQGGYGPGGYDMPYGGGYGGQDWGGYEDQYGFDDYGAGPDPWRFNTAPVRPPRGPPAYAGAGPSRDLQPESFDYGHGAEFSEVPRQRADAEFKTGPPGYGQDNKCKLEIKPTGEVGRECMFKLFDIIPGLMGLECDGPMFRATYESPNWADYARAKYNGLEYPPGKPLEVHFVDTATPNALMGTVIQELASAAQNPSDLQSLVQTLQKAASALSGADKSSSSSGNPGAQEIVRYCDFPLPLRKRPASNTGKPAVKLFIHSKPGAIPDWIVEDLFCRFDGLHSVAWVPGKNYGFVKYNNEESATAAIETLNEKTIANRFVTVKISQPMGRDSEANGGSQDVDMEEAPEAKRPRV